MKAAAVALSLAMHFGFSAGAQATDETVQLVDAPGREITAARCAICHSLDYIQMNAAVMTGDEWQKSIRKMIDRFGAPISDEEAQQIRTYLERNYGS